MRSRGNRRILAVRGANGDTSHYRPLSQNAGVFYNGPMCITCNGQSRETEDGATIASLLGQLQLAGPVAVEVNEQLAPREQHGDWVLADGDRVEIVTLVGGG